MKKLFILYLLTVTCQAAFAQLSKSDLSLIQTTDFYHKNDFSFYQLPGNSSAIMKSREKGLAARYNPVSLLLKGSMWTYQNIISPELSSPCPYQISCSNFAKQSIEDFGIIKGTAIAVDRLMRCNRISLLEVPAIDFDPQTHHIIDPPSRYTWHP